MSDAATAGSRLARGFAAIRGHPSRRWALQVAFAAIGLGLASLHWLGLLAGGALVGVLSDDWRRAVLAGLTFGVVAWLAFAARLALYGALDTYLAAGQLFLASVAAAIGLGALGGLARVLVP